MSQRFREHMDDDFNTGGAIGVLFELATTLNRIADAGKLENSAANPDRRQPVRGGRILLKELGQILGLFFEAPKAPPATINSSTA